MHAILEQEQIFGAVVPSVIGRKHVFLFPGIRTYAKVGHSALCIVFEGRRFYEDRVREHVHIVSKCEQFDLGLIDTGAAFYYLPILIFHCTAVHEGGHTIPGIVVQMPGPEGVAILVFQLDKRASELGKVVIHQINELVAGQFCLFLDDAYIVDTLNYGSVHVPEGGVADEVGIIMKEAGRADNLSVALSVPVDLLHALCTQKADQRVRLLCLLCPYREGKKHE